MQKYLARLEDAQSMKFVDQVGDLFKSLPHLPTNITEFLVKIMPYLALLGGILSLLSGPVIALGGLLTLLTLNPLWFVLSLVSAILAVVTAILMFMAFKPLQDRQMKGWLYIFWTNIASAVLTIIQIIVGGASVVGLVGMVIGFYILFEMRPFYGKAQAVVEKAKQAAN